MFYCKVNSFSRNLTRVGNVFSENIYDSLHQLAVRVYTYHIYHFSSPSHGCRKTTSNIYIAQSFCMCVIQNTKQCNTHLSSLSSSPQNTTNTQFMRPLNYRLQIHIYTFMGTRNHFSIHTFILYMDISCTTQKG